MQEKARKHSSRMRTARFQSPYKDPLDRDAPPGQRPPSRIETPPRSETSLLHRDAPPGQRPPWTETRLDRFSPRQRPAWTESPLDRDLEKEHETCHAIKTKGRVLTYTWVCSKEDTMTHTYRPMVTS